LGIRSIIGMGSGTGLIYFMLKSTGTELWAEILFGKKSFLLLAVFYTASGTDSIGPDSNSSVKWGV
jgi:hypothetical protein